MWTLIITAHAALGDVRLAGRVLEDAVRDGALRVIASVFFQKNKTRAFAIYAPAFILWGGSQPARL